MVFRRTTALLVTLLLASPVAAEDYLCTPTEVAVFGDRIHVRCSEAYSDGGSAIWFWAVDARPTSDAQWANRVLSTATTALVAGLKLNIGFTPGDTSGTAFNCIASDCRKITALGMGRQQ